VNMNARKKLVAGAVAALAVAGAGGAVAATQLGSPKEESQAVIDDAAKQLGIDSSKLTDALEQALLNRVDAAVEAGRLTEERGEALKERIRSGDTPLLGGLGFREPGIVHFHLGDLDTITSYLGLSTTEVRSRLADGQSLAEIARAEGKSPDGLVDAITAAAKEKVNSAVDAGTLTRGRADLILSDIEDRVADLVNGTRMGRFGVGVGPGLGPDFPRFEGVVPGIFRRAPA
jgi:hypothetical protein